ncbi:MAG TPA: hypothetical protein DCS93_06830 [Microscillaceae bacterium]|nr:hypothetical protein [Microscillaceae bacterium]
MILYLLKSIICLLLLFTFYKLALEQVKMHAFKRFYLLGILVFSGVIPLVSISWVSQGYQVSGLSTSASYVFNDLTIKTLRTSVLSNRDWLWFLYFLGVSIFSIRFMIGLIKLRQLIQRHHKISGPVYTRVLLPEAEIPYSFLHYIFLPQKEVEANSLAREVLLHEQAHVDQKHTLDILFMEVLQIFFWWNPIIYWVKNAIKLNHEFLADQQVLSQNGDKIDYQKLLLHYSGLHNSHSLSSAINYSSAKKRILMISRATSKPSKVIRLTFLICLLSLCVFSFNKVAVVQKTFVAASDSMTKSHPTPLRSVSIKYLKQLADEGGKFVYRGKNISMNKALTLIRTQFSKLEVRIVTDGDKIGCCISDKSLL